MQYPFTLTILFCLLTAGCASTSKNMVKTNDTESAQEAFSALTAVTGAVSDRPLSEEELYQAAKAMKDDPEAQSAVEAISSSFDGKKILVKYSPATGKRYSADMEIDPETGVKLLPLE